MTKFMLSRGVTKQLRHRFRWERCLRPPLATVCSDALAKSLYREFFQHLKNSRQGKYRQNVCFRVEWQAKKRFAMHAVTRTEARGPELLKIK
jgi:hypothetical protein